MVSDPLSENFNPSVEEIREQLRVQRLRRINHQSEGRKPDTKQGKRGREAERSDTSVPLSDPSPAVVGRKSQSSLDSDTPPSVSPEDVPFQPPSSGSPTNITNIMIDRASPTFRPSGGYGRVCECGGKMSYTSKCCQSCWKKINAARVRSHLKPCAHQRPDQAGKECSRCGVDD